MRRCSNKHRTAKRRNIVSRLKGIDD